MEKLRATPVVITGATGFIGSAVVASLLDAGSHVTAILRSGHGKKELEGRGVHVVVGRLTDANLLKDALSGAEVLFNFAYDVRASGEENLAAFDVLLDAAISIPVPRIVHASSIVVYDDWPHKDITENSTISTKSGGPYRQAKIEMEKRLFASGIPTAILQPTIVHGPNSALWTERILNELRTGPVVLPKEDGVCNAVRVEDVAQAALRAAAVGDLGCERFVISGEHPMSWHAFYQQLQSQIPGSVIRFESSADLMERLGPLPRSENMSAGPSFAALISARLRGLIGKARFESAVQAAKRAVHKGQPIYPDRSSLELMTSLGHCNVEHARTRLGYRPEL